MVSTETIGNKEVRELYARLCDSDVGGVVPLLAVDEFYAELIAKHPEINTIPEEKIDDHDYCPWSCRLDHSPVTQSCLACGPRQPTYIDWLKIWRANTAGNVCRTV